MRYANDSLVNLVERLGGGDDGARPEMRARLEAALVPMVRQALRSGNGVPAVVRWVRGEVAAGGPTDPDLGARPLAKRLCAAVLDRLQPIPLHARETLCA